VALRSTIYKVELSIFDIDRGYYAAHSLMLARHPSETEERLMVRLLAFAMHADAELAFGRGLSTQDEADLWRTDGTGAITLWIDLGLSDERWIRKACGRAEHVVVLAYGGRMADAWWTQNSASLARCENLTVTALAPEACAGLERLASRSMQLTCTVQDGRIWIGSDAAQVEIEPQVWMRAGER
jgi:uncharacterized protein YaeQ